MKTDNKNRKCIPLAFSFNLGHEITSEDVLMKCTGIDGVMIRVDTDGEVLPAERYALNLEKAIAEGSFSANWIAETQKRIEMLFDYCEFY